MSLPGEIIKHIEDRIYELKNQSCKKTDKVYREIDLLVAENEKIIMFVKLMVGVE